MGEKNCFEGRIKRDGFFWNKEKKNQRKMAKEKNDKKEVIFLYD